MTTENKRDLFVMFIFSIICLFLYSIGKASQGCVSVLFNILAIACVITLIGISKTMNERNSETKKLSSLKKEKDDLSVQETQYKEIREFLNTKQAKDLFKDKYKDVIENADFHVKKIKEMVDQQNDIILDTYSNIKKLST